MSEYGTANVFVLGTGRCGSVTFSKACQHLTNFTTSHESPFPPRFRWEYGQIEVSPRLTWVLPQLRQAYAHDDSVFFVHLVRQRELVCQSWIRRGMQRGAGFFGNLAWGQRHMPPPEIVAATCYDTMTGLINEFLEHFPDNSMTIRLEEAAGMWDTFCDAIDAQGDREAGRREFATVYNR